ncbi:hypothetical protein BH23CYA1_BH23CYA1_21590 [soil metagenome]
MNEYNDSGSPKRRQQADPGLAPNVLSVNQHLGTYPAVTPGKHITPTLMKLISAFLEELRYSLGNRCSKEKPTNIS